MIRQLEQRDVGAAMALFERAVHTLTQAEYTRIQRLAWAPHQLDPGPWQRRLVVDGAFVDEQAGRIRGFGCIKPNGHIDLLFVDPECTRRGVASALLARMTAWAVERDLTGLTTDASTTARPFFESHGFRVIRKQVVERNGIHLENWRMERLLERNTPKPRFGR